MMRKKLCSLLLVGAIAVTMLAGCGGNGQQSNTNEGNDSSEASTDEGTDATMTSDDIVITMMYSGTAAENDFETELLPGLVKDAFPNITLEVTKLPDDQYYTALKTRLASGECPDIILVQPTIEGPNSAVLLAEAGYLEPLTDMKAVELAGVGSGPLTYNDEVYGIASGVTILGTYYNKDLYAQYNLEVPTTWDEFLNCCQTLQDNGVQPIVMGDKDMYVMQFGLYQIACNEVYAHNPDYDQQLRTGDTKFTDEGTWDKVLTMYTDLYDKGYIQSSSLGLGAAQSIQKFVDGEAAMIFDGSFNYAAIVAEGAVAFERGYFPLPSASGETYASMAPGAGPAIYSGSKFKTECKAILEMWYDGESDIFKAYVDSGRVIPTYGYGVDDVNPIYDTFMELYGKDMAFYWCNQAWPGGVRDEMQALLSEYIGGQNTTIEDIANGMQLKFEEFNKGE